MSSTTRTGRVRSPSPSPLILRCPSYLILLGGMGLGGYQQNRTTRFPHQKKSSTIYRCTHEHCQPKVRTGTFYSSCGRYVHGDERGKLNQTTHHNSVARSLALVPDGQEGVLLPLGVDEEGPEARQGVRRGLEHPPVLQHHSPQDLGVVVAAAVRIHVGLGLGLADRCPERG